MNILFIKLNYFSSILLYIMFYGSNNEIAVGITLAPMVLYGANQQAIRVILVLNSWGSKKKKDNYHHET